MVFMNGDSHPYKETPDCPSPVPPGEDGEETGVEEPGRGSPPDTLILASGLRDHENEMSAV